MTIPTTPAAGPGRSCPPVAALLAPTVVIIALLLAGCGRPAETAEEAVVRIMNVEAVELVPRPFTSMIRVTGQVEALHDVTVVAEEAGVVEDILVPKGAPVRKGQVLARLNSDLLHAQLDEARASADLAEEQWQRQKRLWEEEHIGTELAYIQARENARMRSATVRTMETRMEKTTIRSLVGGTFEDYYIEVGEYAVPAQRFARIVSIDQVRITGGVPERYATDVKVGTTVELIMDTCPDQPCVHQIDYVSDTVDPDSRTFRVELRVPNPNGVLKPGMISNLHILRDQIDEAIVIPQEAVLRTQNGYQVFVVETREGKEYAQARIVEMGPSEANQVVILSGLEAGERVITVGQLKLGNGDLLNVVRTTPSWNGGAAR